MEEAVYSPAVATIDSVESTLKTTNSEVLQGVVQEVVVEPWIGYLWPADEEVGEESSCGSVGGLPKEVAVQGYTAASNPDLEAGAAGPEDTPRGYVTGLPS